MNVVEPACAYLASLVSHDGSKIPVAPDAWRIEQGLNTGSSGPEIQKNNEAPVFDVIGDVRDFRWFLSGDDEAIVFYALDVQGVPGIKSTLLSERFKVVDRLITEIEVVFVQCAVTAVNTVAPDGQAMCPKTP